MPCGFLTLYFLASGAPTNTYQCFWEILYTKRQQRCWILNFQWMAIKHPTGSKFSNRLRCKTKNVPLFRSFWSLSDKNVQVLQKNSLLFLQYLWTVSLANSHSARRDGTRRPIVQKHPISVNKLGSIMKRINYHFSRGCWREKHLVQNFTFGFSLA